MARRRHGMALATPGGFSRGNFTSAECARCGTYCTLGFGWLHVQTSSVVCGTCLPDPWAEEPREASEASSTPRSVPGAGAIRGTSPTVDADPPPPRYVGDRVAAELRAARWDVPPRDEDASFRSARAARPRRARFGVTQRLREVRTIVREDRGCASDPSAIGVGTRALDDLRVARVLNAWGGNGWEWHWGSIAGRERADACALPERVLR